MASEKYLGILPDHNHNWIGRLFEWTRLSPKNNVVLILGHQTLIKKVGLATTKEGLNTLDLNITPQGYKYVFRQTLRFVVFLIETCGNFKLHKY